MSLWQLFFSYWLNVFGSPSLVSFEGYLAWCFTLLSVILSVALMWRVVLGVVRYFAGLVALK